LARPVKCCACGQEHGVIDAHAEDYSDPFAPGKTDQFPLCYRCHMLWGREYTLKSLTNGVTCDSLREIFTEATGLRTSLTRA
jgi:hypothetical protein